MAVVERTIQVRTWHSVFTESNEMASPPASVDLVAMLVNFLRPQVVVEAGSYFGHLTFAVANILRTLDAGTIYSADIDDHITGQLGKVPTLQPFLRFHHGDYLAMLADVPGLVDLAYIDASDPKNPHLRWEHAKATYERLRPGALMLIDDTESPDWTDAPRFRHWAKDHGLHLCQHRGLTMIQKSRFEQC